MKLIELLYKTTYYQDTLAESVHLLNRNNFEVNQKQIEFDKEGENNTNILMELIFRIELKDLKSQLNTIFSIKLTFEIVY
ncbi:hypothetical protein GLOIN_2v1790667 [Rhizophagus irregularis DAOM 181602=DAOM 197198]|uniref:Uncharacterized protein n=1 Tax=Rhizophagus irregularis (strain DAOM 181602 / DAOM 197198 / MUCL 43194) TaxID=747089 RepID=U9SYT2_RHIID|nr:hypothetical protein GLOIN_2v1790667 [Rhizophagus irregularis DAOM 181602=DAOM 197198]POG58228.1 hypothetical protein GLOIN_2v1790667 [Rhizophagus irregularis DAOM 181602=DAOM 197198]GET57000.1 hypothetical protein GLOIN_2v1790667 [Rhizophagus irregularis DAOM 181602=DAOM 197198]|eukprot:XP_025165094.1 hypothetical protein GLOIN_2v1790667 [Rhizophagus irregularis DAOM 181602=DAOM 197198]